MIGPDDFDAFFAAVHGVLPYAWQRRLLVEVLADGWPDVVAAPTGAGKTAVLDVAVFALALAAADKARTAPLRIAYAVDRRIVVDQAHTRALRLAAALETTDGILGAVRSALAALSPTRPLHVEALRGGVPREDDWARTPVQPTILSTTVDQLGSRLLFRGYGVSERMAPVHAGLLGEDALIILDEAHLSEPFRQTLAHVMRHREGEASSGPWLLTSLTATPRAGDRVFALTADELAEDALARRIAVAKPARLNKSKNTLASAGFVDELATKARQVAAELVTRGIKGPTVAVVVNRVALARAVFNRLATEDAILLTGRVRPVERDGLVASHAARLEGREAVATPLFVVATQTIEAGADFDFDGMVSQIAPLDALRQRFGRLARRGSVVEAPAAILAAKDDVAAKADDPVYGDRARLALAFLGGPGAVADFGIGAMDVRVAAAPEDAKAASSPTPDAPILRHADVALFSITHPRPHPDPHLPLFLHGRVDTAADVAIVWRADVDAAFANQDHAAATEQMIRLLALVPPRPSEALAVPLWAARRFLEGAEGADDFADVEGGAEKDGGAGGLAFRWRGRTEGAFVRAAELRPGDTLVVPSAKGGCDRFGWAPDDTTPVDDIADRAAAPYVGRRAALRLHPALWGADWPTVAAALEEDAGPRHLARALADDPAMPEDRRPAFARFADAQRLELAFPYAGEGEAVLLAPAGIADEVAPAEAVSDDDDAGSLRAEPETLEAHTQNVEALAAAFAARAALPDTERRSIVFAARWHDAGKADPRFQAYLDPDNDGAPLAKSGRRRSPAADRALREAAALPPGWRHEALSVALAADAARSAEGIDAELVLWLIGTHHGHGRPLFVFHDPFDDVARTVGAVTLGPGTLPSRLAFEFDGWAWADLFDRLKRRYGTWRLAYLEAVLRLADHRASEGAAPETT